MRVVFLFMQDRKAFKFYKSYYDVALELPDKDKLDFLMALLEVQFTGHHRQLKGMAKFAFISQKHSIDAQIEGYLTKTGATIPPIEGASQQEKEKEKVQEKEQEKYAVNTANKEKREMDFMESLKPYIGQYEKPMLREFYNYWIEPMKSGKMRFEAEKFWSLSRRLTTWSNNIKNNKYAKQPIGNEEDQRERIAAFLAAKEARANNSNG